MLAAIFLASQWHFLANKHAVLADCSAFWPVNCIFLHKKGGHVAPLSGPSVTDLYSVPLAFTPRLRKVTITQCWSHVTSVYQCYAAAFNSRLALGTMLRQVSSTTSSKPIREPLLTQPFYATPVATSQARVFYLRSGSGEDPGSSGHVNPRF
jgi:hypothetical protein